MNFTKLNRAVYIAIVAILLSMAQAVCAETITNGYTTASGDKYDLLKGVFLFPSEVKINNKLKDIPATFFFSEGFFAEDPYVYNNHLATASLCLAMAGFYSNEGETGSDADYSNKNKNIRNYMKDIGVDEANIYVNHYNTIRPQTDSIGVTIGSKIQNQNNNRRLVIISIRGSNYEREWTSNVTLGTEQENNGEAKGFSTAAQIVFSEINKYIKQKNLSSDIEKGNVDFWIAGYSRAGATTNLTAKRLVDEYVSKGNKVFAYCIEAPMGGWKTAEKSGSDYNCIHSVINRNDIVPRVAPGFMNFKRYGVDHYLPGSDADSIVEGSDGNKHDNEFYKTDTSNYIPIYEKMIDQLVVVNNQFAFDDGFSVQGLDLRWVRTNLLFREGEKMYMDDFLDEFVKNLCEWTSMTREHYNAKGVNDLDMGYLIDGNIQGALRDCMSILYGSTTEETKAFGDNLKSFWKNAGINKWKELVELIIYPLRKWNEPQWSYKAYYIKKAIRWLDDSDCFVPLNLDAPEKEKLLRTDMPILMEFLLTYAASDYQSELHGTSGLSQLLTFLANAHNIGMNHYPEVTLAWLRAQDTLYDNETTVPTVSTVSIASTETPMAIVAADNNDKVVIGIGEIPDVFVKHGAIEAQLPTKVKVYYSDGTSEETTVTWDDKTTYYVHKDPNDDTSDWVVLNENTDSHPIEEIIWVSNGKVSLPAGATLDDGLDSTVTGCVYEAGIADLPIPSASLIDGEYDGPQTITLSADIEDREIYYCVSTSDSDAEPNYLKYTKPIILGEGLTTSADFILLAYVKGDMENYDDSDVAIWEYTISPADASTVNNSNSGCNSLCGIGVGLSCLLLFRRRTLRK